MSDNTEVARMVRGRFTATYPLMSGEDGTRWLARVLGEAVAKDEVWSFRILTCEKGQHGLQLLIFQVEILMPLGLTWDEAGEAARVSLNEIVNDSDITILWTSVHED